MIRGIFNLFGDLGATLGLILIAAFFWGVAQTLEGLLEWLFINLEWLFVSFVDTFTIFGLLF